MLKRGFPSVVSIPAHSCLSRTKPFLRRPAFKAGPPAMDQRLPRNAKSPPRAKAGFETLTGKGFLRQAPFDFAQGLRQGLREGQDHARGGAATGRISVSFLARLQPFSCFSRIAACSLVKSPSRYKTVGTPCWHRRFGRSVVIPV